VSIEQKSAPENSWLAGRSIFTFYNHTQRKYSNKTPLQQKPTKIP
jgi:hypothetical protein